MAALGGLCRVARLSRRRPGVALVCALLGVASEAAATCPPLDPERTLLWALGQAMRRDSPLSVADLDALMSGRVVAGFPVGVLPQVGPAPLQVGVVWHWRSDADPRLIEFDADGDGVPEVSDTRDESFGHTYDRPGRYPATVTVRSRDGRVTRYATPVVVVPRAAFEADLQARWTTLREALRRKDLRLAVECLHSDARQGHEATLRAFQAVGVDLTMPPIRFVEFRLVEAVYETVESRSTATRPRLEPRRVRFMIDWDGVWRVTEP